MQSCTLTYSHLSVHSFLLRGLGSISSKHVIFALGVDPIARNAGEGGSSNLVSQDRPFPVSCETSSRPVPSLH